MVWSGSGNHHNTGRVYIIDSLRSQCHHFVVVLFAVKSSLVKGATVIVFCVRSRFGQTGIQSNRNIIITSASSSTIIHETNFFLTLFEESTWGALYRSFRDEASAVDKMRAIELYPMHAWRLSGRCSRWREAMVSAGPSRQAKSNHFYLITLSIASPCPLPNQVP